MTDVLGEGLVEAVLVTPEGFQTSQLRDKIEVAVGWGVKGDRHAGATRLSDKRERLLTQLWGTSGKETTILNLRQFSAVSAEDLMQVYQNMGLGRVVLPYGLLGENLVVSGFEDFSALACGTRLVFSEGERVRRAILMVSAPNGPCQVPDRNIKEYLRKEGGLDDEDMEAVKGFVRSAKGLRGIVGQVFSSGKIEEGFTVTAYGPES